MYLDVAIQNKPTYNLMVEHILNEKLDQLVVDKFGQILISRNGQHRLALAKFLEIPKVKVRIDEFFNSC